MAKREEFQLKPTAKVCNSIKDFIAVRQIIDPFVAPKNPQNREVLV